MFANGLLAAERKWKHKSTKLYLYVKKTPTITSFNDIDFVPTFIIFTFSELLISEKLISFSKN